jgi:hypothetical protein
MSVEAEDLSVAPIENDLPARQSNLYSRRSAPPNNEGLVSTVHSKTYCRPTMEADDRTTEVSLYWDREQMATVKSNFSTIVSFQISFKNKPEILEPEEIYAHFYRYIQHEKVVILSQYGDEEAVAYAKEHFRNKDGTYKCVPLKECITQLIRLSDPNNFSEIECYPGTLEVRHGGQRLTAEFFELRAADIGFEYKVIVDILPWQDYLRALDLVASARTKTQASPSPL